jgi:hypothetical protein
MSDSAATEFFDSVAILPAKEFPTEQNVLITYQEMWITYRRLTQSSYARGYCYEKVSVHLDELSAYKYALKNQAQVVAIKPGQDLEEAINVSTQD